VTERDGVAVDSIAYFASKSKCLLKIREIMEKTGTKAAKLA
jgi:hypothetical protein